jgi:cell division protein FtsI/penicillin-binding protein 2
MNFEASLRESCDVFYYDLALRVGIEKITAMAQRLGLRRAPRPAAYLGGRGADTHQGLEARQSRLPMGASATA